jgi:predicted membrane metal-binding protein
MGRNAGRHLAAMHVSGLALLAALAWPPHWWMGHAPPPLAA